MKISRLDHFVLTVASIERTVEFYERVLGMRAETFGPGALGGERRWALHFGDQKINLHPAGWEYQLKAAKPTPGSADFCLISAEPLDKVINDLEAAGVEIEVPPSARTGALGPMMSVYFRDPDANLVEISQYA